MCKILGTIAITDKYKANKIINANKRTLELEPDGFSFYSDKQLIRSLNYPWDSIKFDKYFLIHTRMATTGAVTADNVHCYQLGGWTFAHNGTVGAFGGWGKYNSKTNTYRPGTGRSDSLMFFKDIYADGITTQSIITATNALSFWGIGVLINQKKNIAYIWSKNKAVHLLTDKNKSGLVFASYEPQNQAGALIEAYGLYFDSKAKSIYSHSSTAFNEVLRFNLTTGELEEYQEISEGKAKYNTKGDLLLPDDSIIDAYDYD